MTASSRLAVLHVTAWYPTRESPVSGVFVREHVKAVAPTHDVSVVHLKGLDPTLGRKPWRMDRVTDDALTDGFPTLQVRHGSPSSRIRTATYVAAGLAAAKQTNRTGFRPDLIHAHEFQAGYASAFIARVLRVPVVISEHSSAFPRNLLSPREVRLARTAFARARVVCPVSEGLRRAIEAVGITANFRIVPNCVDTKIFSLGVLGRPPPFKLIFVGMMPTSHIKGIPYLLDALSVLSRADWTLDIVGDGPARPAYERRTAELGLSDRIAFRGLMTKPEIADLMRGAHLCVLPSMQENLPCVLLEAQVTGLPIVATAVGGIPDIIGSDDGLLVPPGDSGALAAAISSVMDQLDRFDRTAIAARAASRYGLQAVGRMLDSIYQEALR